jgi:hypothetical protein
MQTLANVGKSYRAYLHFGKLLCKDTINFCSDFNRHLVCLDHGNNIIGFDSLASLDCPFYNGSLWKS